MPCDPHPRHGVVCGLLDSHIYSLEDRNACKNNELCSVISPVGTRHFSRRYTPPHLHAPPVLRGHHDGEGWGTETHHRCGKPVWLLGSCAGVVLDQLASACGPPWTGEEGPHWDGAWTGVQASGLGRGGRAGCVPHAHGPWATRQPRAPATPGWALERKNCGIPQSEVA
jgi:hypothetical protein